MHTILIYNLTDTEKVIQVRSPNPNDVYDSNQAHEDQGKQTMLN